MDENKNVDGILTPVLEKEEIAEAAPAPRVRKVPDDVDALGNEVLKLRDENAQRRVAAREAEKALKAAQEEAAQRITDLENKLRKAELEKLGISTQDDLDLVDFYRYRKGLNDEEAVQKVLGNKKAAARETGMSIPSPTATPSYPEAPNKDFKDMSILERSVLLNTNPALYEKKRSEFFK